MVKHKACYDIQHSISPAFHHGITYVKSHGKTRSEKARKGGALSREWTSVHPRGEQPLRYRMTKYLYSLRQT